MPTAVDLSTMRNRNPLKRRVKLPGLRSWQYMVSTLFFFFCISAQRLGNSDRDITIDIGNASYTECGFLINTHGFEDSSRRSEWNRNSCLRSRTLWSQTSLSAPLSCIRWQLSDTTHQYSFKFRVSVVNRHFCVSCFWLSLRSPFHGVHYAQKILKIRRFSGAGGVTQVYGWMDAGRCKIGITHFLLQ
jgi:hypothetical protein